jgi:hypothetical protein
MVTVSFIISSPKIIEFNLGNFFSETASYDANVSMLHKQAARSKTSQSERVRKL